MGKASKETPSYLPTQVVDNYASEKELAAEERKRQEENAAQLEERRKQSAKLGSDSTLGEDDELAALPTLLGGQQNPNKQGIQ